MVAVAALRRARDVGTPYDVSSLKIGNTLHVSDLKLPAGIKVLDEPGNTVCIVQVPKVAVEPIVDGAAEPEVIRAKPKADEK